MELISNSFRDVLNTSKTIVIVGCSPNEFRTSNYVGKFMKQRGYTIIPVNPGHKTILNETCYRSLMEIPKDIQIDIVNVFRSKEHTLGVVEEVNEWKKQTGQNPVVWTQLDVSSPQAENLAEEEEIPYIKNRCIMVEWERVNV